VTNLDYNEYIGRLGTGRVFNGTLREGDFVAVIGEEGTRKVRLGQLYVFDGLARVRVTEAPAGELFAVAGIDEISIGDTLANPENPRPLPRVTVDEPTIAMFFMANTGPFSGLDGKYVTSRNIRDRLDKELMGNVSLKVEDTDSADKFKVVGRGELALSVLIENMRREGYELMVSKPEVVTKVDDSGTLLEPLERVVIDIPSEYLGVITEKLALRKGRMDDLRQLGGDRQRAEFLVPSRGLIGYRSDFMNDTRGTGVMNTLFEGWAPWAGDISYRKNGALVSDRRGKTTTYALFNLQPRGVLFLGPQEEIYAGMVVGEHAKAQDLDVNAVREKQLTNFRTVNKDAAQILSPPRDMTLEEALQWISEDEYVEVTPSKIRVRKKELDPSLRKQASRAFKKSQG
jgi:GTP-binding protein